MAEIPLEQFFAPHDQLSRELHRRDPSPQWKQVVEVRPGRFTHHLELRSAAQVDAEVLGWLREAWEAAA